MDAITDQIWIGNYLDARDLEQIRANGIKSVLCLDENALNEDFSGNRCKNCRDFKLTRRVNPILAGRWSESETTGTKANHMVRSERAREASGAPPARKS